MSKFKYKKSVLITVVISLLSACAIAGIVTNIINIVQDVNNWLKVLSYSIILAISVFMLIASLLMLLTAHYKITDTHLVVSYGVITERVAIQSIKSISIFKSSDNLVVYYNENKYQVILISPDTFDDFIVALRNVNENISLDIKSKA